MSWLNLARERTIENLGPDDEGKVREVFQDFEGVLGPVGAAKALHLLAPAFFPLWDRAIAVAYGLELGRSGTNGARYLRLMKVAKEQAQRLRGASAVGRNVLKALDEYNYCRYTKGWL